MALLNKFPKKYMAYQVYIQSYLYRDYLNISKISLTYIPFNDILLHINSKIMFEHSGIPAYVINLSGRKDCIKYTIEQFTNKEELNLPVMKLREIYRKFEIAVKHTENNVISNSV